MERDTEFLIKIRGETPVPTFRIPVVPQHPAPIGTVQEPPARKQRKHKPSRMLLIEGWDEIRKAIIERDGYQCRNCERDGVEAVLHIHHKDRDRTNNAPDNLITLCSDCHLAVHGGKVSL